MTSSAPATGRVTIVIALLLIAVWVTSAFMGADYLGESLNATTIERGIGWPVALVVFALTTTVIWLGLVVITVVIAWRKWPSPSNRPASPGDSAEG